MMKRIERLDKIREILSSSSISSQEELQLKLQGYGHVVTQATLSRDLRSLRVLKIPDSSGELVYSVQDTSELPEVPSLPDKLEGVVSIEFSGQLGVLKTYPGFANAVAYFIDRLKLAEVMGTIAGDDTILIIARDGVSENKLAGTFTRYFKDLQHKFK